MRYSSTLVLLSCAVICKPTNAYLTTTNGLVVSIGPNGIVLSGHSTAPLSGEGIVVTTNNQVYSIGPNGQSVNAATGKPDTNSVSTTQGSTSATAASGATAGATATSNAAATSAVPYIIAGMGAAGIAALL